ncbi:PREDICTED: fibrous sheath CABYR-binding protein-like [Nicotiana attenuata]|uniref:fibrous sheath CABYR-binding protein-like n=1 Tax=Nicotiana attenuata TaxID=49451 RepID=UPI0009051370|nr:PREDICTED: fibrous sheath CABYR-binding protein-like [Nicotiana attenuata]
MRMRGHSQRHCRVSHQGAGRGTTQPASPAPATSSAPSPAREPEQLHEPFSVFTPVGEPITAARVYRGCVVTAAPARGRGRGHARGCGRGRAQPPVATPVAEHQVDLGEEVPAPAQIVPAGPAQAGEGAQTPTARTPKQVAPQTQIPPGQPAAIV